MTVNIDTVYHDLNSLAVERVKPGIFTRLVESARKICEVLVSAFPRGRVEVYELDGSNQVGVWVSQSVSGLPAESFFKLREEDAREYLEAIKTANTVEYTEISKEKVSQSI